jgi:broad specificity phosphatase PhoE
MNTHATLAVRAVAHGDKAAERAHRCSPSPDAAHLSNTFRLRAKVYGQYSAGKRLDFTHIYTSKFLFSITLLEA